jgi:dinuclear metal center YbgI/SA1388 family protein
MIIKDVEHYLETIAPKALQEDYDNAGLITGNSQWPCTGILVCLDSLEAVVDEAIALKYNLIIAHHPIIFKGLKKVNGNNYIERIIIKAIKNDIAIYAIHTNLDNIANGVSFKMAALLELQNLKVLAPKTQQLKKIFTYAPAANVDKILSAIFKAGGGQIGNYAECSFRLNGIGSFTPMQGANPKVGAIGEAWVGQEVKLEVIIPFWKEQEIIQALKNAHEYEEVAYEVISLDNYHQEVGAGAIGTLPTPFAVEDFLQLLKQKFNLKILKHTPLVKAQIQTIALCGGSGSFLINAAKQQKADVYISADIKYHEFFDADNQLVILDIGHYETEQFTIDLLVDILKQKFVTFAIQKTRINTNSVNYF